MSTRTGTRTFAFTSALVALVAACGNRIGDPCTQNVDCSSEGDRICDTSSPGGYCTVEGCDHGTCPGEAVCARFFPVSQLSQPCQNNNECAADEICVTGGKCAPRSTERRFCMLTCGSKDDCREHYECRNPERMKAHGGEPVPDRDGKQDMTPFCAPSRPCRTDADCDLGDKCDRTDAFCVQAG